MGTMLTYRRANGSWDAVVRRVEGRGWQNIGGPSYFTWAQVAAYLASFARPETITVHPAKETP